MKTDAPADSLALLSIGALHLTKGTVKIDAGTGVAGNGLKHEMPRFSSKRLSLPTLDRRLNVKTQSRIG